MPSHPLYPLTIPAQTGILLLTPCPGTANIDLASAIGDLKTADAKAVLTLMTEQELQQNHVEALPEQCRENGIEWFHLPVDDDEAPAEAFSRIAAARFTNSWMKGMQSQFIAKVAPVAPVLWSGKSCSNGAFS